jgi:CDP-diglyceride synthetase
MRTAWTKNVTFAILGGAVLAAFQTEQFTYVAASLLLGLLVTAWWVLFWPRAETKGMHSEWARLLLGVLYIPLPLSFFPLLLGLPEGRGWGWLLLTFAATWGGDAGAYFSGRLFGRTAVSSSPSGSASRCGRCSSAGPRRWTAWCWGSSSISPGRRGISSSP